MELQASRNSPRLADKVSADQPTSSYTQAQSQITEFAAASTLNSRCDVCSQNLRACIVAIEHAVLTNSNTLEKVRLRELQKRLEVCLVAFMQKDRSQMALDKKVTSRLIIVYILTL